MRITVFFAGVALPILLGISGANAQRAPDPDYERGCIKEGGNFTWRLLPKLGVTEKKDCHPETYIPLEHLNCRQLSALIFELQKELFDVQQAIRETPHGDVVNLYNMGKDYIEAEAWAEGLEVEIKRAGKIYSKMTKEINKGNPYECHVGM